MVYFHEQRAITPEGMVWYEPLWNLEGDIMVLNNVTKLHKTLIKIIQLKRAEVIGLKYVQTDGQG